MSDDDGEWLLDLFRCFEVLTVRGIRFAGRDEGTKAGIMEAAGRARASTGSAFPLVGVSPAAEIVADCRWGSTEIDPNHSYVLAETNDPWRERSDPFRIFSLREGPEALADAVLQEIEFATSR